MAEKYEVITLSSSDEDSLPQVILTKRKGNKDHKAAISSSPSTSSVHTNTKCAVTNIKTPNKKSTAVSKPVANNASNCKNIATPKSLVQDIRGNKSLLKLDQLNQNQVKIPNNLCNGSTAQTLTTSENFTFKSIFKESAPVSFSNFKQKIDSVSSPEILAKNSQTTPVIKNTIKRQGPVQSKNSVKHSSRNLSRTPNPIPAKTTSDVYQRSNNRINAGSACKNAPNAISINKRKYVEPSKDTSAYRQNKSSKSQNITPIVSVSNQHVQKADVTKNHAEVPKNKSKNSCAKDSNVNVVTKSKPLVPDSLLDTLKKGGISITNVRKNKADYNASVKNDSEVISSDKTGVKPSQESHKLQLPFTDKYSPANTDLASNSLSFNTKQIFSKAVAKLINLDEIEIIETKSVKQQSTENQISTSELTIEANSKTKVKSSSRSLKKKAIPLPYGKLDLSTSTIDITKSTAKPIEDKKKSPKDAVSLNALEGIKPNKVTDFEIDKQSNFRSSLKNDVFQPKVAPMKEEKYNSIETKAEISALVSAEVKDSNLLDKSSTVNLSHLNGDGNKSCDNIEILKKHSGNVAGSSKCDPNSEFKSMNSSINEKEDSVVSHGKEKLISDSGFRAKDSNYNFAPLSEQKIYLACPDSENPLLSSPAKKSNDTTERVETTSNTDEHVIDKDSGVMKSNFKSPQRSPAHAAAEGKPFRQVTSPKLSLKRKRSNHSDCSLAAEKTLIEEEAMDTSFEIPSKSNDSSDVSLKENVSLHQNKKKKSDPLFENKKKFDELLDYCKIVMIETEENKAKMVKNICHKFESTQTDYLSSYEFSVLLKATRKGIENNSEGVFVQLNTLVQELKANKMRKSKSKPAEIKIEKMLKEDDSYKDTVSNLATEENRAKDSKERLEKHAERLEKLLEKYDKAIKKLQKKSLSLDDMDVEDSTYVLEDRYKRRFVKIWTELCKVKKRSTAAGRQIERKFCYEGTRFTPINKAVEKKINKQKSSEKFPNYIDILQLVKSVNERENLGLNEGYAIDLAKTVFRDVGSELKKRRQYDDDELLNGYLPENFNPNEDPAEQDETLRTKLNESIQLGSKRIAEVIDEYAEKQHLMPDDIDDQNIEDVNEEHDDQDPDDEMEERNCNSDDDNHLLESDDENEKNAVEDQGDCSSKEKNSSLDKEEDINFMEEKKNDVVERIESFVAEVKEPDNIEKEDAIKTEIMDEDDLPVTDYDSKSSDDVLILPTSPELKNDATTISVCPPTPEMQNNKVISISCTPTPEPDIDAETPVSFSCPTSPLVPSVETGTVLGKNEKNSTEIESAGYICEDEISIGSDDNNSFDLPSLDDLLKKS